MERMLQPDQIRQLDDTAEQIMRADGLDKASLDEICKKVASWGGDQQYRGENMIVKGREASLNAQRGLQPGDLEIKPKEIHQENKPQVVVGGP